MVERAFNRQQRRLKDYKIVIQFPIERSKYYQIKERFVNKIYQCCIYRGLVEYQDILDEEIG